MASLRRHLLLLARRRGAGPKEPILINGIQPLGRGGAWLHHARLAAQAAVADLRVAEAADGFLDLYTLWEGAKPLTQYLAERVDQLRRHEARERRLFENTLPAAAEAVPEAALPPLSPHIEICAALVRALGRQLGRTLPAAGGAP